MNQNQCNNCGGEYEYRNGRWVCRACGAYKPEAFSSEEQVLLNSAYQKLRLSNFAEAEKEFDDIISQKSDRNPHAYWGRLMAKYGIKYEKDYDGKTIPTCYAASIESILSASDYKKALQYADAELRENYRSHAEYVERVRAEWVEKASREKPYDIFISYKESDQENGIVRTEDSLAMQELYTELVNRGYRVFYSHISLRDKVGEKYEPYIFNALSTAKVMLVYGSKPEYITSTWIKNEWTRYEKKISEGQKDPSSLLVACDGFSPGELPTELASRQCFDASAKTFYVDLYQTLDRLLGEQKQTAAPAGADENHGAVTSPARGKKSKAPIVVTICLLLAVIAFVAIPLFSQNSGGGGVTSVTNSAYNATVVVHDGEIPKDTEFYVEDVPLTEDMKDMLNSVQVDRDTCRFYEMDLRHENGSLSVSGNVTVTIPLPEGISADLAAVYYMSGKYPEKISSQVSGGKITFVTNHFSVYMIAQEIGDCPHDPVTDARIEPTCTEDGLSEGSHCALCGMILAEQTVIPAFGHDPAGEASCKENSYCKVCGIELAPQTDHEYVAGVTEPTCTEQGYTTYTCEMCGDHYVSDHVDATGHTPGADATCTEPCYCSVCGEMMSSENGHIPGAEATCTAAQTCVVCGTELAPKIDHNYSAVVTEPTCTERGYTTYTCECGENYISDDVPERGHILGDDATCTEPCYCTVCGEMMSGANGHVYGPDATCTTAQTCVVCGIELAPVRDHDMEYEVTEPTCTEQGYTTYNCRDCEYSYVSDYTEALGHTAGADATCTEPCYCVICGEMISGENGHVPGAEATCTEAQTCQICHEVIREALGHDEVTDPAIPPTKTEDGLSEGKHCSRCGEVTVPQEIAYATGTLGLDIRDNGDGTAILMGLGTATDSEIYIPAYVNGIPVTAIGEDALSYQDGITKIVIPETVRTIGAYAFSYSTNLREITIPETVTEIGAQIFFHCESLTTLHYNSPYGNSENPFIQQSAITKVIFGGTYVPDYILYQSGKVTAVEISDSVTEIGTNAFSHSTALTSVVIGNGVDAIRDEAFRGCSALASVTLGEGVTAIGGYAFAECGVLTEIRIPAGVETFGDHAFFACASLARVTLEEGVREIGSYAFAECAALVEIAVPASVKIIRGYAFEHCTSLADVTFNPGLEEIGGAAFMGCTALTEITLPYTVKVMAEGSNFYGCTSLTDVVLSSRMTAIPRYAFGFCTSLERVEIPDSVTRIEGYAFENCTSLVSIEIPDSVSDIETLAFHACYRLAEIINHSRLVLTVGSEEKGGIARYAKEIHSGESKIFRLGDYVFYLFENTPYLLDYKGSETALTLPASVEGSNYAIHAYAFLDRTALTSVVIPSGVREIGEGAFAGCTGLARMTVPFVGGTAEATEESPSTVFGYIFGKDLWREGVVQVEQYYRSGAGVIYEIPQSLREVTVTGGKLCHGAFWGCDMLTDITVTGVTEIGPYALFGCNLLTEFLIPESVTAIGEYAFHGCTGISEITVPDTVESIGEGAFAGCTGLTEMSIPFVGGSAETMDVPYAHLFGYIFSDTWVDVNTVRVYQYYNESEYYDCAIPSSLASVTVRGGSLGYGAFHACAMLTDVTLEDSVTEIGPHAFCECTALTDVRISNGVTAIGAHAFELCTSLAEFTVPTGVTAIPDYMFQSCEALERVTVGENVQSIGANAFYGCGALGEITLPNVQTIGDMAFAYCRSITGVTLGESLRTVGEKAFLECELVTELVIPSGVTSIGEGALGGWSALETLTLPFVGGSADPTENDRNSVLGYIFGGDYYHNATRINQSYGFFYIPNGLTSLTVTGGKIMQYAFRNCSNLTEIVLPDHLGEIGPWAFYACESLENIEIPASVTSIGEGAFQNCTSLARLEIPDGVTAISTNMLSGCKALADVTIGAGVREIGDFAFRNCWELKTVVIPDGVLRVGACAFEYCTAMESITIPFTGASADPAADDNKRFSHLFNTNIPESLKTVTFTGTWLPYEAFWDCDEITKVILPEGVEAIPARAFYGCDDLVEVVIPESVTSIGEYAFAYCRNLTVIRIPSGVTEIGDYAFDCCESLPAILGNRVEILIESGSEWKYLISSDVPEGAWTERDYNDSAWQTGKAGFGDLADSDTNADLIGTDWSGSRDRIFLRQHFTAENFRELIGCRLVLRTFYDDTPEFYINGNLVYDDQSEENWTDGYVSIVLDESCLEYLVDGDNVFAISLHQHEGWRFIDAGLYMVIPDERESALETIGKYAFRHCLALTSVTVPASVTTIGEGAFNDCVSLEEMTLPFVGGSANAEEASASTLFGYIFGSSGMDYMENIYQEYSPDENGVYCSIPDGLRTVNVTGGELLEGAFYGCHRFWVITLSEGITSIGDRAFYGCDSIWWIELPSSLVSIGESAFADCLDLHEIRYGGTSTQWLGISKGIDWNDESGDYTVICTDSTFEKGAVNADVQVGDTVLFGAYEQDNNTENGAEAIEWLVLDKKDGKALVITKYGLDCHTYYETYSPITWENSALRAWMNDGFLNAAFTSGQQERIVLSSVSADANPNHLTSPGGATQDRIFALSIGEALTYFASSNDRKCAPTAYAMARGSQEDYGGWRWWLRTPGSTANYASHVWHDGNIHYDGDTVHRTDYLVRPAMWIDLNA